MNIKNNNKIGVHIPEILLPAKDVDISNWCVVACDQYTSQPEYWEEVKDRVGDKPSTLHMIFPEVYLEDEDNQERIQSIVTNMQQYLKDNIMQAQKPGLIYIDRKTSHAASRKGLMLSLDLEEYDYNKGSQSLIRATEGTVLERIPPRVKVRENAPIELPHIMVLIDDPDRTVIEPIAKKADTLEKLYDVELMMDGGHIVGYQVDSQEIINDTISALEKLAQQDVFAGKYGVDNQKNVLLFAVGDGNHSLATAKACWENVKPSLSEEEKQSHPARYALVELVNVHDDGLAFEPIHRVVFNIDMAEFLEEMVVYYNNNDCDASYDIFDNKAALESGVVELKKQPGVHVFSFVSKDKLGAMSVKCPQFNLEVGTLQAFLDQYIAEHNEAKIDYIHGEEAVYSLGTKEGNVGFLLPPMDKHDLFKTVIVDGVLPRKTFSMGEAEEKRFYLECRKIIKD